MEDVKLYMVGGYVRDMLMGLTAKDLDYAVEAPSYFAMKEYIIANNYTIFEERPQFQTIRASHPNLGHVDFVLCRKERDYQDGRRPSEVEIGDIYDDLARRDFTINAIAIDVDDIECKIDPYDGQGDIKRKLIRCVGDTESRFTEDSLRLLRAFRFAITKGFKLSFEIRACLNSSLMLETLDNAKKERWYEELKKCFEFNTLKTLQMLSDYPVLRDKIFASEMWLELYSLMPTLRANKNTNRDKAMELVKKWKTSTMAYPEL